MSLELALAAFRQANRVDGTRASYRKDNPAEYTKVMDYLDGGPRPAGADEFSLMGQGFVWTEDYRRGVTSPPPTGSEPAPIAGLGYRKVFEDDFDTLDTSKWRFGYGNGSTATANPGNYSVVNSILTIVNRPSERTQRDLQTKFGTQYGYFRALMRYTKHPSAWASHWMMSKNWLDSKTVPPYVCEFDIFEAFHNLTGSTWRSHSSTLHKNTSGPGGVADEFRPNWTQDCGYDLGDKFVWYDGWWTKDTCSTYVNEKLCKTWPTFGTSDQPMYSMLGIWSHDYSTEVRVEVDKFEIWQK